MPEERPRRRGQNVGAEWVSFYHDTFVSTHPVIRVGYSSSPREYPVGFKWFNNSFISQNGVMLCGTGLADEAVEFATNLYFKPGGPEFQHWNQPPEGRR